MHTLHDLIDIHRVVFYFMPMLLPTDGYCINNNSIQNTHGNCYVGKVVQSYLQYLQ